MEAESFEGEVWCDVEVDDVEVVEFFVEGDYCVVEEEKYYEWEGEHACGEGGELEHAEVAVAFVEEHVAVLAEGEDGAFVPALALDVEVF